MNLIYSEVKSSNANNVDLFSTSCLAMTIEAIYKSYCSSIQYPY